MALGSPSIAHAAPLVTEEISIPLSTSTIRAAVVNEFGDTSIMISIAACESEYRQFNALGKPLAGAVDPDDTGVFQINKRYHLKEAQRLGIDIDTLEGNMEFARVLFERNGTRDWRASKHCWDSA